MKKTFRNILVMLTAALMIVSLAGCKSTITAEGAKQNDQEEENNMLLGGWQAVEDGTITPELQEMFDRALENLTGVGYRPIKLVATQVVSGMNYKFLCEAITLTSDMPTREAYVTIYKDLQGNVSILDIEDDELEQQTEIANPFAGYQTVEEAERAVGFSIALPEGYEILNVSVMSDKMLQIDFENGTMIRKMAGSEDISGDYNKYEKVETVDVNGAQAEMRINGGKVYSATWQDGGYTYALFNTDGISIEEAQNIITAVK